VSPATGAVESDVERTELPDGSIRISSKYSVPNEIRDPLEHLPEFASAFRQASAHAEAVVRKKYGKGPHIGACHLLWETKKRYLRERFLIDWRTPAELNPDICYD